MTRRIAPLLVALAVAAAPVASEVCLIACASAADAHAAMHHASHESGHSCHDADTTAGPHVAPIPHSCGHDGEEQPVPTIGVGPTQTWILATPLAVTSGSSAVVLEPPFLVVPASPLSLASTGPTSVRSVTPLRI